MKRKLNLSRDTLSIGLVILFGFAGACSDSEKSTGIPRLVSELGREDLTPSQLKKTTAWEKFAAAIGVGTNVAATQAELETQVGTPSSYLVGAKSGEYEALLTSISASYLKTAPGTKCSSIESVDAFTVAKTIDSTGAAVDLAGSTAYLMKYKLQADALGTAETNTRTAILVIPTATGTNSDSSPIVAYGHGGAAGLNYGEVAKVFGAFQTSHIIVAPTFPGEAICKVGTDGKAACDASGELAAAVGTRSVWDGDADELLGAHDCTIQALSNTTLMVKDISGAVEMSVSNKIGAVVMMHDGFNPPIAQTPSSMIVGSSRGGLVALLAVARAAAAGKYIAAKMTALGASYDSAKDGLGAKYGAGPSLFHCAATFSSPITITAGKSRFALESLVRGDIKTSPFYALPGIPDIAPLFDAYAASVNDADLEVLKIEVLKRDATIVGPLIMGALQDWTQGSGNGKGSLLMVHGTFDKVVGFENMQLGQNIFLGQSEALVTLKKAPGVSLYSRAIAPTADYLDAATGQLKAGVYQHGDAAFLTGIATLPSTFIASSVTRAKLSNAQAEGAAGQLAGLLFSTAAPTDAELAIARNYVLSGYMTNVTPALAADKTSIVDKNSDKALLTPELTFAVWRKDHCPVQDTN
jgi:hypothetical protein